MHLALGTMRSCQIRCRKRRRRKRGIEGGEETGDDLLLHFVVFLFFLVVLRKVTVFASLAFLVLFIFLVEVVGNQIQVDGVRLRDFQLGLTLGTAKNLAFFHFVLVNINFGGTLRAADHDFILRGKVRWGAAPGRAATTKALLYTA
jgi:hypothetical protein